MLVEPGNLFSLIHQTPPKNNNNNKNASFIPHQLPAEFEVGVLVPKTICSYTVNVAQKRGGSILSPTYPGAYPKDMLCTYQFIGKESQRIRLEFRDFDLFFGGPQ